MIAAVVLNWNGRSDTERCVRSLLGAGGPDRVLVLDSGSRGGEAAALRDTFAAEGRVEVVALPRNLGFAGGANEGVRRALAAGADGVLLLNNDALLEEGALARLRAALAEDPGAAAASPLVLRDDPSGRVWFAGGTVRPALGRVAHRGAGADPAGLPRETRPTEFLTFCAVLVSREAWIAVGTLEEEFFAYGEDVDWCLRARRAGRRLLLCPGAVARHRVNAALGAGSPAQAYLLSRARVILARRHCGAVARALLFWPWTLLVGGPRDFLGALLRSGWAAAAAGVGGLRDGARGGPPRRFRAELGLEALS